mgnify:CR=1 FL=1
MTTIGVFLGSVRRGRIGEQVANWVMDAAGERDAEYRLLDLAEFDVPHLVAEVVPGAANKQYEDERVQRWSSAIDSYDAFVFVTPEYNHGVPAAMKNALDVLYPEWNHKGLSLVGYGADGGVRAIEHWRTIAANVHLHPTREQVSLSIFTEFGDDGFTPGERRSGELVALLNSLVRLTAATRALRS